MAREIRRIVVALDDSVESRTVLEEAVALAVRTNADLIGLFIEDATLLAAARHPFIRQVSLSGQAIEAVDSPSLERGLRAQAESIRRALERAVGRQKLSWSFRVARGKASVHILEAVGGADLVIMGKTTPAVTRRARLGATARIVATTPRGRILFSEPRLQRVLGGPGPIVAVYGEGPHADDVLDIAITLARVSASDLMVMIPTDTADDGRATEAKVTARLAEERVRATFRAAPQRGCDALVHSLSAHRGALLVLAQDTPLLGHDSVADLIERLDSPGLIVAPNHV